jgi:oxaloacetate decarboxylase (Na+ extruding) subunit alpha
MSTKRIKVIDTTMRDGQQCLWATRMTTAMMLPIAEQLDLAGYDAIDLMGSIQFDVCVRYLRENPWDRIRLMRQRIRRTPLKAGIRSKSLVTFGVLPDDVVHLWVELLVRNGIGKLSVFDALADLDNIIETMKVAQRAGCKVGLALVYTDSPVHTDEYYARKVREAKRHLELDHIMVKDSGGLLTVDRVRTLVPALRKAAGRVPIELHSHCMTGLAPLVYLEGVKAGADAVQTATAPLANGPSQPATQTVVRNLRSMGYEVALDDAIVGEASRHFGAVAQQEGKPVGVPHEYDAWHYQHQLPGGMLTNLQFQLGEAGMLDHFDAVLAECARIREELGWPIMVTPFAQFVAIQAVYNITTGERYRIVPDEVKKYALGYYGRLVAPVGPEVLDRIVENGSKAIGLKPEATPPAVEGLRRKYPNASDEERLLRFMFAGGQVDDMLATGPMKTTYEILTTPLARMMRELMKLPRLRSASLRAEGTRMELRR